MSGPIENYISSVMNKFCLIASASIPNANVFKSSDHCSYGHIRWHEESTNFPVIRWIPLDIQWGTSGDDRSGFVNRIGSISKLGQFRCTSTVRCKIIASNEAALWNVWKTLQRALKETSGVDINSTHYNSPPPFDSKIEIEPNLDSDNSVSVNGIQGIFDTNIDFFDTENIDFTMITIHSATITTELSGSGVSNNFVDSYQLTSGTFHI